MASGKLTCLRLKKWLHWPGQVAELTEAIQNSEQILEKNQTKNRLKAISWEMDGTWGNTYPQAELFRLVHYKLWFIGIVYVILVHWQSICTRDIDMANRITFICWLVTTTWYFLRVEISTPNQKNNNVATCCDMVLKTPHEWFLPFGTVQTFKRGKKAFKN